MPITEEQMSHEEMKAVLANRRNVCADCEGQLSIAWGGMYGYESHILRCSVDITHTGYISQRKSSVYPGSHVGGIPVKEYREMEEKLGNETATKLVPYSTSKALNKVQATEIVETLWGDAPALEKAKAISLCVNYQLNPLMRHLYLVGYNKKDKDGRVVGKDWTIMVAIQANRLLASRNKDRPFGYAHDTPRLMTEEEELRYYKTVDAKKVRAITILVDKNGLEARGIGQIDRSASIKGTDKGNSHENMACIRSERAALDRMCPGEMPQNVEVTDAEWEEVSESHRQLDTSTGEIIEGESIEEETSTPIPTGDEEPEPEQSEEPDLTPLTKQEIADLQAMLTANDVTMVSFGKWLREEKGWPVTKFEELNRWHLSQINEAFVKGKK